MAPLTGREKAILLASPPVSALACLLLVAVADRLLFPLGRRVT